MNSPAGFDDDDFFGSYNAEQASQSLAAHELDAAEPAAPSAHQLAHTSRFRKPVALFLGTMALLSLTALALRGSQPALPIPSAQRDVVAHYSSALPAATAVPAVVTEAEAPFEPVVWTRICVAPSRCLLDPSAASAWLSVPLSKPVSVEASAFHPTHPSSARARRPVHGSSLALRVAASPPVTPVVAVPKPVAAAPAGFTSVARFPDER